MNRNLLAALSHYERMEYRKSKRGVIRSDTVNA